MRIRFRRLLWRTKYESDQHSKWRQPPSRISKQLWWLFVTIWPVIAQFGESLATLIQDTSMTSNMHSDTIAISSCSNQSWPYLVEVLRLRFRSQFHDLWCQHWTDAETQDGDSRHPCTSSEMYVKVPETVYIQTPTDASVLQYWILCSMMIAACIGHLEYFEYFVFVF